MIASREVVADLADFRASFWRRHRHFRLEADDSFDMVDEAQKMEFTSEITEREENERNAATHEEMF